MTLRKDSEKVTQECHQIILQQMLKDEDNKYCVECDAKSPRWASWNLGLFLCIRCAGIHRNLGVHISKIKSVNLDSWIPQQLAVMLEMGNSRGRAVYEANVPDDFRRPQTDTTLEQFIRDKYVKRRYIAREWNSTTPNVNAVIDRISILSKKFGRSGSTVVSTLSTKRPVATQLKGNSPAVPSALPRPTAGTTGTQNSTITTSAVSPVKPNPGSNQVDLLGLDAIPTEVSTGGDFINDFGSSQQTKCLSTTDPAVQSDLFGLDFGQSTQLVCQHPSSNVSLTAVSSPLPASGDIHPIQQETKPKSTKESILALYETAPVCPAPQYPPNMFVDMHGGPSMNQAYGSNAAFMYNTPTPSQSPMYPGAMIQGNPSMASGVRPRMDAMMGPPQHATIAQQQQQAYLQHVQQKLSGLQLNGGNMNNSSGWTDLNTDSMSSDLWQ